MLTVTPITMMIQAEEQAKHLEQTIRMRAEDMQHTLPSVRPMPRWLAAISHVAARLGRKALHQPTVTACCIEEHSCAHV